MLYCASVLPINPHLVFHFAVPDGNLAKSTSAASAVISHPGARRLSLHFMDRTQYNLLETQTHFNF